MEQSATKLDFFSALKGAISAGLLAFLLFGPIMGLILSGYSYETELQRPLIAAAVVFVGKFLFALLHQIIQQKPSLQGLLPRKEARVWVEDVQPHGKQDIAFFSLITAITVLALTGQFWITLLGAVALYVILSKQQARKHQIMVALILILGLLLPFFATKFWLTVLIAALIYVLLGLGLNIVVGLAGLLDLGFVAFYAVGAYGYGLGHEYLGLSFWLALPLGALMAACFGAILGFPVLRMHGDYLAIVTLGFGEIIRLVLNNWTEFTHGPNGVSSIPPPTLFGLEFSRVPKQGGTPFHEFFGLQYDSSFRYIFIYLILFVLVLLMVSVVMRLRNMPIGRAWEALREDEIACRSLGINHVTVKLSAFSMGAMVGGMAGVFFAAYQGFINPSSFTFFESALILAIVVLGGLGSTVGVIIAAFILTILPESLRYLATALPEAIAEVSDYLPDFLQSSLTVLSEGLSDIGSYRVLIFGICMVLMMIWRPRGLLPIKRKAYPRASEGGGQ